MAIINKTITVIDNITIGNLTTVRAIFSQDGQLSVVIDSNTPASGITLVGDTITINKVYGVNDGITPIIVTLDLDYTINDAVCTKSAEVLNQTFSDFYRSISVDFRYSGQMFTYQLTEPLVSVVINEVFGNVDFPSLVFRYNTVDSWDPSTIYSYIDWKNLVEAASPGDFIRIENNSPTFQDDGIVITYEAVTISNPFTYVINVDKGIDNDIILNFDDKINITSLTSSNSNYEQISLRQLDSASDNYTEHNYQTFDIASINTAISGLLPNQPYKLHIATEFVAPNETNTITLQGNYIDTSKELISSLNSVNSQQYRAPLQGNCKFYDGVLSRDQINGYNQFDSTDKFYMYMVLYISAFNRSNNNTRFIFSTYDGVGADPFMSLVADDTNNSSVSNVVFALRGQGLSGTKTLAVRSWCSYGYNTIQISYDGSGLASGLKFLINGTNSVYALSDNLGGLSILNASNVLNIGCVDSIGNKGFYAGGIRKMNFISIPALDPMPTSYELREDFINGEATLRHTWSNVLDIDTNKTGSNPLTDNGIYNYPINTFNGYNYLDFYSL